MHDFRRSILPLFSLLLGLLLLQACARPPANVVLITVDTLRADRVGVYGAKTTRTPNFDRLAAEGVMFSSVVAPLPETRPSHATMFTSLYPRDHGVVSNALSLGQQTQTLAEVYAEAGYRSAAFVGCALFYEDSGLQQGFETVNVPDVPQRPASEVVPAALKWLTDTEDDRPFFLWLHLFDPHMPYEPPAPWNAPRGRPVRTAKNLSAIAWPRIFRIAARNDGNLPRAVFERAMDLYDGEVEHADHWVGQLFAGLEQLGHWHDTVIALTADHGECFEEGVYFDHSQCLAEGALAVPLLIRAPGRVEPGLRIGKVVGHLDLAPTLLELSDLEVPPAFAGRDLLSRDLETHDVFFQHPYYDAQSVEGRSEVALNLRSVAGHATSAPPGDQQQIGVRRDNWKYVLRGERGQLINLDDSLSNSLDRASEEPGLKADLHLAVGRFLSEHPFELQHETDLNPELIANLRALGYLD